MKAGPRFGGAVHRSCSGAVVRTPSRPLKPIVLPGRGPAARLNSSAVSRPSRRKKGAGRWSSGPVGGQGGARPRRVDQPGQTASQNGADHGAKPGRERGGRFRREPGRCPTLASWPLTRLFVVFVNQWRHSGDQITGRDGTGPHRNLADRPAGCRNARNARTTLAEQIAADRASILEFGFTQSDPR